MPKVTVDHNGGVHSKSTGQMHTFTEGVAVELPQDAIDALGERATLVKEPKSKESKEEKKEVKEKEDTNIEKKNVVTK